MTDEQVLFAVICFLYITDCFLWLDRHSVVFVLYWWKKCKLEFPSALFGNGDAGLVLLNPFPPLGLSYICHLPPLSISPIGICAYNLQTLRPGGKSSQSGKTALFTEIKGIHSKGKDIIVNDSKFVKCKTESEASTLTHFLSSIISVVQENRESLIKDFFRKALNHESVWNALKVVYEQTRILRLLCNLSFFFIFLVTPALAMFYGLKHMIIPLGICFFLLSTRISVEFYASHKMLYPQASEDRIGNLLKMILCPPVAIRALDVVANPFLDSFNPLNVANLLLDKKKYTAFAKEFMLDLKYPIQPHHLNDEAMLIVIWHNNTLFDLCKSYLDDVAKLNIDLFSPPIQTDDYSKSYCPRCHGQFTKESEECPDCFGVKLALFPKSKEMNFKSDGLKNG